MVEDIGNIGEDSNWVVRSIDSFHNFGWDFLLDHYLDGAVS